MSRKRSLNNYAVSRTAGALLLVAPLGYASPNERTNHTKDTIQAVIKDATKAQSRRPILEVDPETGTVTMHFPLGMGIGSKGTRYTPSLVGRMGYQVQVSSDSPGNGGGISISGDSGFALSPGILTLLVPVDIRNPGNTPPHIRWTYPDGSGGCTTAWERSEIPDPEEFLSAYGLGLDLGVHQLPWGEESLPIPFLTKGEAGELVLALQDRRPGTQTTSESAGNYESMPQQFPSAFFVVRGETGFEYHRFEDRMAKDQETWIGHYRLTAIRSMGGEMMAFTYGLNGSDFSAKLGNEEIQVALESIEPTTPVPSLFNHAKAMTPAGLIAISGSALL
jgi:hypothetical protein